MNESCDPTDVIETNDSIDYIHHSTGYEKKPDVTSSVEYQKEHTQQ